MTHFNCPVYIFDTATITNTLQQMHWDCIMAGGPVLRHSEIARTADKRGRLSHTQTHREVLNKRKSSLYQPCLFTGVGLRGKTPPKGGRRRVGGGWHVPAQHLLSPTFIYVPQNKGKYWRQPTSVIIQVGHIVDRFKYGTQCAWL